MSKPSPFHWYPLLDANRTMKPVEVVLRRGDREPERGIKGVNLIEVQGLHVWKCYNETPL
jgi:hypothetical protein